MSSGRCPDARLARARSAIARRAGRRSRRTSRPAGGPGADGRFFCVRTCAHDAEVPRGAREAAAGESLADRRSWRSDRELSTARGGGRRRAHARDPRL